MAMMYTYMYKGQSKGYKGNYSFSDSLIKNLTAQVSYYS